MTDLAQFEIAAVTPEDQHRPDCPKCHLGMWLVGREKRLKGNGMGEHRTYVCEICGEAKDVTV